MPGKLPAKAFDIHPRPGLVGVSDEGKLWGPKVSLPLGFFLCKLDWGGVDAMSLLCQLEESQVPDAWQWDEPLSWAESGLSYRGQCGF